MRLRKKIAALAVAAASVVFPMTARATLIAYDGFNYTQGELQGKGNASSGWNAAWFGAYGTNKVDTAGFTWPNLVTSGNKARTGGNDQAEWRMFAGGKTYGGVNGGTIWVSFLAKGFSLTPDEYPQSYAGISLFSGPNSEPLFMGMPTQHLDWGWDDDRNKIPTATNIPFSEEHFFVYRIDFGTTANAPETVRMFVDPKPGVVPDNSTAVLTNTNWAPFSFDRVRIDSGCDTDPEVNFDELRIATTYNEAAPAIISPVPEPASLAVLSLGVILIRRSRRNGSVPAASNA